MSITTEEIISALRHVNHPAAGKHIVELNMVSDIRINDLNVEFTLVFTKSHDPMRNTIVKACEKTLKYYVHPDIESQIHIKDIQATSNPLKREKIQAKNIIAVASGKGGVGKSTVTVNLAVALSKMGYSVGLLDADIYGPSIPKMLGMENAKPAVNGNEGSEIIVPVEQYGVRMLSAGFFVNSGDAVIWRGPMVTSALRQLITQGAWGGVSDYFLIDLPPGTGDVHLTIVQELPVTGAIIVSTPQDVALADTIKSISMFQADRVNVPILGLVENMAWFTPEELPENRYYIFGNGGCKALAEKKGIRLLGQIPIVKGICEGGDSGQPVATDENSITGNAFMQLAQNVISAINERNKNLPPTVPLNTNRK